MRTTKTSTHDIDEPVSAAMGIATEAVELIAQLSVICISCGKLEGNPVYKHNDGSGAWGWKLTEGQQMSVHGSPWLAMAGHDRPRQAKAGQGWPLAM